MSKGTQVKPTHKAVKEYYAALERYAGQKVAHEGAVRSAFQNLLADSGRKFGWTLIPELTIDANGQQIRPDGTFRDEYTIERGYWEAKDTDDDIDTEIGKKIKRGYRLTNTIFEDTREGRLYQDGKVAGGPPCQGWGRDSLGAQLPGAGRVIDPKLVPHSAIRIAPAGASAPHQERIDAVTPMSGYLMHLSLVRESFLARGPLSQVISGCKRTLNPEPRALNPRMPPIPRGGASWHHVTWCLTTRCGDDSAIRHS